MALSSLTSLTYEQYRELQITPFTHSPIVSSGGSPDRRINVQLAGWVGTDLLAFTVTDDADADSSLSIENGDDNILKVDVSTDSNPDIDVTYWTIDMGAGASGSDWQITFDVADGNVDTGKWVFVKGKTFDD